MQRFVLLLAAGALVSPADAAAKEWITFSAPSGGVEVGESVTTTLTLPVDGGAPLPRRPELVFTHDDSVLQRRFAAEPTGKRGVFRVRVALATAGTWTVYVYGYEMGSVAPAPSSRRFLVRPSEKDSTSGGWVWTLALATTALVLLAVRVGRKRATRCASLVERVQTR